MEYGYGLGVLDCGGTDDDEAKKTSTSSPYPAAKLWAPTSSSRSGIFFRRKNNIDLLNMLDEIRTHAFTKKALQLLGLLTDLYLLITSAT